MLREYGDLISRLGTPLWWDDNGVPRYEPFVPDLCGVYDTYVALLLVECQSCGEEYRVASSARDHDMLRYFLKHPLRLPDASGVGSFHFGDPPPHCCQVGATMNSVPRAVLEFWRRDGEGPQRFQWRRDPQHEVHWAEDEGWGGGMELPAEESRPPEAGSEAP